MQAQHPTEGKKPKKNRQHSAPPSRSKAGGLAIAKESIDFLFNHSVRPVAGKEFRPFPHRLILPHDRKASNAIRFIRNFFGSLQKTTPVYTHLAHPSHLGAHLVTSEHASGSAPSPSTFLVP